MFLQVGPIGGKPSGCRTCLVEVGMDSSALSELYEWQEAVDIAAAQLLDLAISEKLCHYRVGVLEFGQDRCVGARNSPFRRLLDHRQTESAEQDFRAAEASSLC